MTANNIRQQKCEQSGRSMLEMLGVLAIMGLISIGVFAIYRSTLNAQLADTLYNDFRVRSVFSSERKSFFASGTKLQDNGDIPDKDRSRMTRSTYGNPLSIQQNTPLKGYFTITVFDVQPPVCQRLLTKEWPTDQNGKKMAQIYIDSKPYPSAIQKCPDKHVSFAVAYRSSHAMSELNLITCTKDEDCICLDANNCTGCVVEKGTSSGACHTYVTKCSPTNFWDGSTCQSCVDMSAHPATLQECLQCYGRYYKNGLCHEDCSLYNSSKHFRIDNGTCVSCYNAGSFKSSEEECNLCEDRYFDGDNCLPPCSGTTIRDSSDGKCEDLSTTEKIYITAPKSLCPIDSGAIYRDGKCYPGSLRTP